MADLAEAYPELVKMYDFGETWQGQDPLRVICITADADQSCQLDPDVDKPRLLLIAQTHAREITTSELMWRTATYLIDGYGKKADATSLLDGTEIWIVNNVNPRRRSSSRRGSPSRAPARRRRPGSARPSTTSTRRPSCGTVYANRQEGIDLNRSFDIAWGEVGTSPDPCDQTYGGPEAASEPETTGQVELMEALFRDQRDESEGWDEAAPLNTTGSFMNFHSYSNLVMPPWSHWLQRTANDEGLRSLSFRLSHYNGYETGQSSEILYPSSGGTDDWAYQDLGVSGVTFEIGPGSGACAGFFPAYSCQDRFEDENLPAILYAGEAARAPYKLSLGPTTLSAKAKLKDTGKVQVKINASDDAYGIVGVDRPDVQNVTAARIYVGKAPWDGGTAKAMTIKGSGSEVTATIKVTPGGKKKLAWTQAKDADGNWGPVRARLDPEGLIRLTRGRAPSWARARRHRLTPKRAVDHVRPRLTECPVAPVGARRVAGGVAGRSAGRRRQAGGAGRARRHAGARGASRSAVTPARSPRALVVAGFDVVSRDGRVDLRARPGGDRAMR